MMHHVSVIKFQGRAVAACTCRDFVGRDRFGKSASKQANYDGRMHLEHVEKMALTRDQQLQDWLNYGVDDAGHVVDVTILDHHVFAPCPLCEGTVDLGQDFHSENLYAVCDGLNHEFVAYYYGESQATLFTSNDPGPFNTTF